MNAIGRTSSMMAVLMLAAAGANRTWAEPEVAGPGDPWVLPHPPLHRETTVRRLDDIRIGRCWGWYYRASPDGRHLATLEWGDGEGKKAVVTRDGVRGPGYDGFPLGCGCNFLTYSPDSAHLAYPAIRDGKCYVARDGAEEGPYDVDGMRGWFEIAYSPDSRRLAYGARRGGKPVIVVDGKIEEAPGAVRGIRFDSTSTRLAYMATLDGKLGGKMCLVVDGKPGRWCDGVCPATFDNRYDFGLFTPVGNRAVEIGRTGDTWTVSVEGRTPWTAKGEDIGSVRLSRDGARGVACNRNDGPAVFSPDGTRLGQWVQRGAETRPNGGVALVVDGKDVVTYRRRQWMGTSGQDGPVFSPDGAHWAALARLPGDTADAPYESVVIVDGKEVARGPYASLPVFSPDGKRHAYCLREAHALKGYVNGEVVAERDMGDKPNDNATMLFDEDGDIAMTALFSPNSRHVVFAMGERGKDVDVYVDGKWFGAGERVTGLTFRPDGAYLLWCEQHGDAWRVQINGWPGIGFAAALTHRGNRAKGELDPVFHFAGDSVSYLVMFAVPERDADDPVPLHRVEEKL